MEHDGPEPSARTLVIFGICMLVAILSRAGVTPNLTPAWGACSVTNT